MRTMRGGARPATMMPIQIPEATGRAAPIRRHALGVVLVARGYPKVDYTRTVYVQCLSGGRASLAARTLKTLGFTHPVIVLMNFGDWVKAGNRSSSEPRRNNSKVLVSRNRPGR